MRYDVKRNPELDERELRRALESANLPSVLPALYQLTGDERWLSADYAPPRALGFDELDDAGLSEDRAAEVRDAMAAAVLAWSRGAEIAVPHLTPEQARRIAGFTLGMNLDADYGAWVATHLGLTPEESARAPEVPAGFDVLIVGAGFSGLAAAVALQEAGIPFTILEKNEEVGGTWWENDYPGARTDVPSILYSLSFVPHDWADRFATRDELSRYLIDVADRYGLRERIEFGTEVSEMRWDEADQSWTITAAGPEGEKVYTASAVISAVGLHNRPAVPDLPGADMFSGTTFHSAEWPEDAEIDGRRVAVIGSGASAMQVVPAIADRVSELTVYQRSAHWINGNPTVFDAVPDDVNWLLRHVPFYRAWYRFRLHWFYGERIYPALPVDPEWDLSRNSVNKYSEANRQGLMHYLHTMLGERPDLLGKCVPTFPPFGKRLLQDNGWFDALLKPHVELVNGGVSGLTSSGVLDAEGVERKHDTVILCTGFQQQRVLSPMEVVGVGGRRISDDWAGDDARAYLGMTVPNYPNLFLLYGPNTNPPGGSWVTIAEDQIRYIVALLEQMQREGLGAVAVREDLHEAYNAELDEASAGLVVGLDGVDSYYRNARGRVVTNSPWTILDYWTRVREPDLDDFETVPARGAARATGEVSPAAS